MESSAYLSCNALENMNFVIQGNPDTEQCIKFCCVTSERSPTMPFGQATEETIDNYLTARDEIIRENAGERPRKRTVGCTNCAEFQTWTEQGDGKIRSINLSVYPSPCQCRCAYCDVHEKYKVTRSDIEQKPPYSQGYEKVFAALECLISSDLLSDDAKWLIACGEIAIHPYRDRFFDLLKGRAVTYYSNCFVFSERIAENLCANPCAALNLSIDSGTADTWKQVKGANNLNIVLNNIRKYAGYCAKAEQIILKYIVLPGINTRAEDYAGVISIMKELDIDRLWVACDYRSRFLTDALERQILFKSVLPLLALLRENGMRVSFEPTSFTQAEVKKMQLLAIAKSIREKQYA